MRQMPVAPQPQQGMSGANPMRAYQGMSGGIQRTPGVIASPQQPRLPPYLGAAQGQMPRMEQRVAPVPQGPVYMANSPRFTSPSGGLGSTVNPLPQQPTVAPPQNVPAQMPLQQQPVYMANASNPTSDPQKRFSGLAALTRPPDQRASAVTYLPSSTTASTPYMSSSATQGQTQSDATFMDTAYNAADPQRALRMMRGY